MTHSTSIHAPVGGPMTDARGVFLSPREKQLLRRFAGGKTDRQIACDLGGRESAIAAQRVRLAAKLRIETTEQLRAVAQKLAYWPRRPRERRRQQAGGWPSALA